MGCQATVSERASELVSQLLNKLLYQLEAANMETAMNKSNQRKGLLRGSID